MADHQQIRPAQNTKAIDAFPGVIRKLHASGDAITLVSIEVKQDNVVPKHVHPHEQAGTVISGRVSIRIGDVTTECGPGDGYYIPGGIEHEVTALEPARLVEGFTPVREDFLAAE